MRSIIAYYKKSFLTAAQYKFNIFMGYISPLLIIIMLYLLSYTPFKNSRDIIITMDNYTMSYSEYAISGVIFSMFLFKILTSFCLEIERTKRVGHLEMLLISSTSLERIIVAMFTWRFIFILMMILPYLFFGVFYIRKYYLFTLSQFLLIGLVLLPSVIIYCSYALCISGLVLLYDRIMYFTAFFVQGLRLFGDVFIPISFFPESLKIVIKKIPLHLYCETLRGIVFDNQSLIGILPNLSRLFIIAIILCPISVIFFKLCLKKAMKNGILGRY